jgi:hypothetical protein
MKIQRLLGIWALGIMIAAGQVVAGHYKIEGQNLIVYDDDNSAITVSYPIDTKIAEYVNAALLQAPNNVFVPDYAIDIDILTNITGAFEGKGVKLTRGGGLGICFYNKTGGGVVVKIGHFSNHPNTWTQMMELPENPLKAPVRKFDYAVSILVRWILHNKELMSSVGSEIIIISTDGDIEVNRDLFY